MLIEKEKISSALLVEMQEEKCRRKRLLDEYRSDYEELCHILAIDEPDPYMFSCRALPSVEQLAAIHTQIEQLRVERAARLERFEMLREQLFVAKNALENAEPSTELERDVYLTADGNFVLSQAALDQLEEQVEEVSCFSTDLTVAF